MESLVEEMSQCKTDVPLEQSDSIHSGESKFKNYRFDASRKRSPLDIKRCVDFWKYIEDRQDLFPQRGYKLKTDEEKPKKAAKNVELTWANILNLLKQKKMDKVAHGGIKSKEPCKIESCIEESKEKDKQRKLKLEKLKAVQSETSFDDFKLENLDVFDPQKMTYADAETQTDPIETADKETQTDLRDSRIELQEHMKELDDLLKELAGADLSNYFECICEEPCAWLPYPTDQASIASHTTRRGKSMAHKCTCSCGQIGCLCSLCAAMLEKIQGARDSFAKLSTFEIEQCPCANASCACLDDYRTLLDIKLEITRVVREATKDPEAEFGLPMRCQCSCHQTNCPCKIVMELFAEMDDLMGYQDKPLFYYDKQVDRTFGVDVCRCDGEGVEEPCACLSFYRQRIADKLTSKTFQMPSSNKLDGTPTSGSEAYAMCSGECVDECTPHTCSQAIKNIIEPRTGDELSTSDSDVVCLCEDRDCLPTIMSGDSSVLMTVNNYDETPLVPPNSTISQLGEQSKGEQTIKC